MMHIRSKKLPSVIVMSLLAMLLAVGPFFPTTSVLAQNASTLSSSPTANLANAVDPFTGTGVQKGAPYGGGDTFPGADVPFGMVQWSPDTVNYAPGGYWYPDHRIRGFSLTHLNGAGCGVYSDIPFMPYIGQVTVSPATHPKNYISFFPHANEAATAGYYQVKLDNGVNTELTATQHSGAGRFTYPQGKTATILVNVSGSINGVSDAQANIGSDTISGWATSGGFCGASDVYRVYFWAQFSQPFATFGTWHNNIVTHGGTIAQGNSQVAPAVHQVEAAEAQVMKGTATAQAKKIAGSHPDVSVSGPGSGAFVSFDTSKNAAITVKVGLSFVSIASARGNVNQENPSNNFDQIHQQATQTWNSSLGEIQVSGGSAKEVTTFYTAMYHALLQPNVFSDVNGKYIGFDGRIHSMPPGHAQYANFSGWDIYRSEAQLLALLAPNQAGDIAQSMINDYTQSGMLPKWSLANAETYVMVGDPADPILADIYAFGGTNFDTKTALAAMIQEATKTNNIRPGLNYLKSMGYLPVDGSYGCCNFYGPASTTLEYNTADFSIGAFAQALGDTANYQKFTSRSQDWENLLNPADSYLEPRYMDGSFQSPYDPTSGNGWVEGDGAQYNWMVPFNLRGLFDALGGNSNVVPRLDNFFKELNGGPNSPYAFLGNEPTLETPWEYDYAGAPYKTQNIVREAVNTLYMPGPGGMAGNDDLGEMSSWYVFAALGMYPETPGTANMVLASPLFPNMTVHRPSGQVITIKAPGASASTYYVQSLMVNGQASTKPWLPPSFIASGGTLDYTLSTSPNTSWGSNALDAPPSFQYGQVPDLVSFKPGRPVVAPGGTTQGSIVAQNIGNAPSTITWSATAPTGITITPSSGSFTVPVGGSGNQSFTIAASANLQEGYYSVPFSVKTSNHAKLPPLSMLVVVANPGSLLPFFNNIGISNDSNPSNADFDGSGYSYSAQQLASDGYTPGATVTVNGINYTWPNVPVATFDNIAVNGQTIQTPNARSGATQLTFLGSATNGPSVGNMTITYTDGTSVTAQLGFTDWTINAGGGSIMYNNVIAAKTNYRNSSGGTPDPTATYVFATAPVQLDTSKQVASITLPSSVNQGTLHIFAITIS